ncbi:MAG: acyltransferase 3 [Candidatus Eremiobacteraeota bacterium]|nr:acyltransferase 3 [Candidatus Eremiobacteraeota bacterium]
MESRDALKPLTSLRFAAALLVFSWHCVPTRQISATFSLGYAGVSFFFLLSGFILTYGYHRVFAGGVELGAVRTFYAARIARVYPLHLITLLLMVLCLPYLGENSVWTGVEASRRLGEIAAGALLIQSWFPDRVIHFGSNGPAWSISVEAFFYALFPVLAFALLRLFRTSSPRIVLVVAGALWLAATLVLAPQHAGSDDWRFYVFPPARLVEFVVGMLLGIAFLRRDPAAAWPLRATSVEMLAIAAAALAIYASPLFPRSLQFSAGVMPAWAFLISVFAWRRGAISRFLEHPVLVRLGEVSYAFYLVHLAVIMLFAHTLGWGSPLAAPLMLSVTLALSFALYHGIEQPLRRRIRTRFAPGPPARVHAAIPAASAP